MGTVAASAHHNGKAASAISPSTEKLIQNILRCMALF